MGITVNRINVLGNMQVGIATPPPVDSSIIYDWTFTETTGPYPNLGSGGTAGDIITVDAGVVRGVSTPKGLAARAWGQTNSSNNRLLTAGGSAQATIDAQITTRLTVAAWYTLENAPSFGYRRILTHPIGPTWPYFGFYTNLSLEYQFLSTVAGVYTDTLFLVATCNSGNSLAIQAATPGAHLIVMTMGPEGATPGNISLKLYIDGSLAATSAETTDGSFWRYEPPNTSSNWSPPGDPSNTGVWNMGNLFTNGPPYGAEGIDCLYHRIRVDNVERDAAWVAAQWAAF